MRVKRKRNKAKQNNETKKCTGMQLILSTSLIYSMQIASRLPHERMLLKHHIIMISIFQMQQREMKEKSANVESQPISANR